MKVKYLNFYFLFYFKDLFNSWYFLLGLDTSNVLVKKEIFDLLGALCVYNSDGYNRALEVLEHYKVRLQDFNRIILVIF